MNIVTENGIGVKVYVDDRLVLIEELTGLTDTDVDTLVCGVNGIFGFTDKDTVCRSEVILDHRGLSYGGKVIVTIQTSAESELTRFISRFDIRRLWEYIECYSFIGYCEEDEDDTEKYLLKKIS